MSSAQGITDSNLQAAWQTYCLSFASTSIIIWDHVVTIDQEVEYFWSGELDISRVLYLSIRYLALGLAALSIYVHCYVPSESTIHTIDRSLYAGYILAFVIILLCQAVVALRVWYLFSNNRFIRIAAPTMYAVSVIGCSVLGAREWDTVRTEFNRQTDIEGSVKLTRIWYIFFPCLVVHTVLFLCKIWRVVESKERWRDAPMLRRMLKEGAVMYIFATGTLLFSIIGLSENKNPLIYDPALLGDFAVAATVVSVCRAMLSIKSLAAMWHVDPSWLLNHAELSRVHWRRGGKEGELVVELGGDVGIELH